MSRVIPKNCRAIGLPLTNLNLHCVMSFHRAKQNDPQKTWLYNVGERVLSSLSN
ncbi:hypothetical protein JCM19238_3517 [Vibrio ponticus]|nr:hypothetical protein JCM19238_3517 [Vibrio ponticus]